MAYVDILMWTSKLVTLSYILSDITCEGGGRAIVQVPKSRWQGTGLLWGWYVQAAFAIQSGPLFYECRLLADLVMIDLCRHWKMVDKLQSALKRPSYTCDSLGRS